MAGEAITTSGSFVSTGATVTIPLVYSPDWFKVINLTAAAAPVNSIGYVYEWWASMSYNNALITSWTGAQPAIVTEMAFTQAGVQALAGANGIIYYDNQYPQINGIFQSTAISNATPPVVTVASTAGMFTGGSVRLTANTAAGLAGGLLQLAGMDFTITVINGTTFSLNSMPPIVPGTVIGVQFLGYPAISGFQPRNKYITAMRAEPTNLAQTTITFSVTHGYSVGEILRLYVPAIPQNLGYYVTIPLVAYTATVVAVGIADVSGYTNTVTVDMNAAAFGGTFIFPLTGIAANVNYQWAYAVPFGENTAVAEALNAPVLQDSVTDKSTRGVILQAGNRSPAGRNLDLILWMAGTAGLPND